MTIRPLSDRPVYPWTSVSKRLNKIEQRLPKNVTDEQIRRYGTAVGMRRTVSRVMGALRAGYLGFGVAPIVEQAISHGIDPKLAIPTAMLGLFWGTKEMIGAHQASKNKKEMRVLEHPDGVKLDQTRESLINLNRLLPLETQRDPVELNIIKKLLHANGAMELCTKIDNHLKTLGKKKARKKRITPTEMNKIKSMHSKMLIAINNKTGKSHFEN